MNSSRIEDLADALRLRQIGLSIFHLSMLASCLYCSTVIAACVFANDAGGNSTETGWLGFIWRGGLLFVLLSVGWLYFHRFKVVRYTYLTLLAVCCVAIGLYYYAGLQFGDWVYKTVPTKIGLGGFVGNSTERAVWWVVVAMHAWIIPVLPVVGFLWFLARGYQKACPVCPAIDGLYARRIVGSGVVDRRIDIQRETVKRVSSPYDPGRLFDRHLGHISIETKEDVVYEKTVEQHMCVCKVCNHKWSFNTSSKKKLSH